MMGNQDYMKTRRYLEALVGFDYRKYENENEINESVTIFGSIAVLCIMGIVFVDLRDNAETFFGIMFFGFLPLAATAGFVVAMRAARKRNEKTKEPFDVIGRIVKKVPEESDFKVLDMNVAKQVKAGRLDEKDVNLLKIARAESMKGDSDEKDMCMYTSAIEKIMKKNGETIDCDLDVGHLVLEMISRGMTWRGSGYTGGGYGGHYGHDPRSYSFENDYGGYGNDIYVGGNFVDY